MVYFLRFILGCLKRLRETMGQGDFMVSYYAVSRRCERTLLKMAVPKEITESS